MLSDAINELKQYRPAQLCTGIVWYIAYYAYDPESKKLERKRIKVNQIDKIPDRRRYAYDLIKRLNSKLESGWNPFVDPESNKSYSYLNAVVDHFLKIAEKKLKEKIIREETLKDYTSYLRNLQGWVKEKFNADIYIYKLDRKMVSDFLEYIFVERDRTARTRNNYLNYLRVFAGFCLEKSYVKTKFTDGIDVMKSGGKVRKVIETNDLEKLKKYLLANNPHYLLACLVLYNCLIRPRELTYLQIKHISKEKHTVILDKSFTKNKKDASVTLPDQLLDYMNQLGIFDNDPECFLFSTDFKPGKLKIDSKRFRDYWLKLRKELKFPAHYQFYSLKDTGITDMLGEIKDTVIVRDQARHSSISITDLYTPHDLKKSNAEMKGFDGKF